MSYDSKYTGAEVEELLDQVPDKLGKTEKAADSAKLGGVAATEYAKSSNVPSLALQGKTGVMLFPEPSGLTAGWYRIGVTTRTPQQAWTFRMILRRSFNYNTAETYVIDVAIGYSNGSDSNVYFTQVAGGIIVSRLIDKVRVTVTDSSKSYIDIHIAADCKNNILYLFEGDAEAYASGTIVTGETSTTYEFSTVDGLASSHNITAPKFIGALARPLQDHGTGDTTFTLTPNILHQWGTVSSLTLTLGGGVDETVSEYTFQFTSGTTATTLSLPSSVKFPSELTVEANKIYQISIVNNLALISSWDA